MKKQQKRNRFCELCPAKENKPPDDPCPLALERIHAMQAEAGNRSKGANLEVTAGCPWYVNSAEHNYCFWNLANELAGSPIPDREICQLLGITQSQLNETFACSIKSLQERKDDKVIRDFIEAVIEKIQSQSDDNTVYLPEHFRMAIERQEEKSKNAEPEEDPDTKPLRKGFGMPMHRDGQKVDLFGLYSQKTLEKKMRKKRGKRKKKNKTK